MTLYRLTFLNYAAYKPDLYTVPWYVGAVLFVYGLEVGSERLQPMKRKINWVESRGREGSAADAGYWVKKRV